MKEKLRHLYYGSPLATKIRYSYLILMVPMFLFLVMCFYNLWSGNRKYEDMINSAVVASDFSLDFKKDFDYETYLLIVGNTTIEESKLDMLLADANRIVRELESLTESEDNEDRLNSAKKYLKNLGIYIERVKENLLEGDKYEDNIQIWEKDIQIVTELLQETIFQYIYFEIRDIQQTRNEYQEFYEGMIRYILLAFAGVTVLVAFLSYYIPRSITRPIRELSKVTDQVAKGNLSVRASVSVGAEVGVLSESMNTMIDKINQLLEQVKTEQTRLRKAEFEVLQAQINPHFLYNTLDTIVWLAEDGEQEKVVSMVESLSEFFRSSLNQGKDIVTVKEELTHVRSYLEIQQVRYQDILEYEICVSEELWKYRIPKITIQPLVENALYHGIKNKRGSGKIAVDGYLKDGSLCIVVKDNGIGMKDERLKQVSQVFLGTATLDQDIYGLYNVNERIRLNFGEQYGIRVESVYGEGTTVIVKLPCLMEEEKERRDSFS